jgi:hypothetical protein
MTKLAITNRHKKLIVLLLAAAWIHELVGYKHCVKGKRAAPAVLCPFRAITPRNPVRWHYVLVVLGAVTPRKQCG